MAVPLESLVLPGNTEKEVSPVRPESLNVQEKSISEEDGLPPKDGGQGAWLFLFGACVFEIVSWGFPYSWGVFRAYLFTNGPFEGVSYISVAGVMSNGLLQISMPFILYVLNYFPHQRKLTLWMGCFLCFASALGGAFSKTPIQLIICLGPLYGIGAGMLFAPTINYMSEWFDKKKSLAYGIICGMGGLFGAILPPIFTATLNKFGFRATMIAWAIAVIISTGAGAICIKPRTTNYEIPKASSSDWRFLRRPLFWIISVTTVIQGLAHYVPSIYLPSYALDFNMSSSQGSLVLSMLNVATAIGQPLQGILADWRSSFYIPMIIGTVGASLEVLVIWAFAHNLWSLIIFALLYGATAGGFAVLRPRFANAIAGGDDEKEQSLLIFGILTALRGAAIIASGFIVATQLDEDANVSSSYGGGKWRNVILYTGIVMMFASLGGLGRFTKSERNAAKKKKETTTVSAENQEIQVANQA